MMSRVAATSWYKLRVAECNVSKVCISGASSRSFSMGSLQRDARCRSNCSSLNRGPDRRSSIGTRKSEDLARARRDNLSTIDLSCNRINLCPKPTDKISTINNGLSKFCKCGTPAKYVMYFWMLLNVIDIFWILDLACQILRNSTKNP